MRTRYVHDVNERSGDLEPRGQVRIQSVSRAVSLLLDVAESPDGRTVKELADRAHLSLPTTYHLVTTLWAEGLLSKDASRVFRIGPRASSISEAYLRLDAVPQEYKNALQAVVRRTGETAYLGVWRNSGVRVIDRAEGMHAVRVVGLDEGYTEDIHARASGKLLLAFLPSEEREQVVKELHLRKRTPHTITKRSQLLRELEEIRMCDLAFDLEEFQLGVKCVSAPIRRGDRVVACITVSSPSQRFEDTRHDLIAALEDVVKSVHSD